MSDDAMGDLEAMQAMRDLARLARAYYLQLVDEGFTPDEALALTAAYSAAVIKGAS